jgi:hypothetical protein
MFVHIGIGIEVAKLASRSLPYNLYDAGWSSPVARRAHNPKVLTEKSVGLLHFSFLARLVACSDVNF